MRVIGIDPGSRITGYGVVELQGQRLIPIEFGAIKLTKYATFTERLEALYKGILTAVESSKPDYGSIEKIFMAKNANSALKLGHARGVALLALHHCNLGIDEYSPTNIKKSVVGYGHADKQQVTKMVSFLLGLKKAPQTDAADALAIAICHLNTCRTRHIY